MKYEFEWMEIDIQREEEEENLNGEMGEGRVDSNGWNQRGRQGNRVRHDWREGEWEEVEGTQGARGGRRGEAEVRRVVINAVDIGRSRNTY